MKAAPAPPGVPVELLALTTAEDMARTLRTVAQGWPQDSVTRRRLHELSAVLTLVGVRKPSLTMAQLLAELSV